MCTFQILALNCMRQIKLHCLHSSLSELGSIPLTEEEQNKTILKATRVSHLLQCILHTNRQFEKWLSLHITKKCLLSLSQKIILWEGLGETKLGVWARGQLGMLNRLGISKLPSAVLYSEPPPVLISKAAVSLSEDNFSWGAGGGVFFTLPWFNEKGDSILLSC